MAYRYNERTGEFEDLPKRSSHHGKPSSSSSGGSPSNDGSSSDFGRGVRILLKRVLPILVAVAFPSVTYFISRD